jgi:hypothetical protein
VEKPDAPVDKEEDESAQTPSADHAVEKTDNQVEPEGEK